MKPDGRVVDQDGTPIGKIDIGGYQTSQTAVGLNGKPLGYIQPDARVIDFTTGEVKGVLTPSGQVLHPDGYYIGRVHARELAGLTVQDGSVIDAQGRKIGTQDSKGAYS